jgi:outer membrane protein insertion porin family
MRLSTLVHKFGGVLPLVLRLSKDERAPPSALLRTCFESLRVSGENTSSYSWWGVLSALFVLCVPLSAAPVAGQVESPPPPVLRELRIASDARVDDAGLRNLLPFEIGRPVGDADLEEARRRLELKGIFRQIDIETVPADDGLRVTIRLRRKPVVRSVKIVGSRALRRRERERLVRFGAGTVYQPSVVDEARRRILDRYEKIGFVGTRIDVLEEERRPGEIDLVFEVDEGIPLTIVSVEIEGDPGLWKSRPPRAIRRLVGQRRTRELQRRSERLLLRELRKAGYFEARVDADWEAATGRLGFVIEPGPAFEFVVKGNRAKSEKSLLVLADLHDRLLITDGTWREMGRRMEETYRRGGYYRAEVRVSVREGPPKTVTLTVDEGRRYFVRRVRFEGNERLGAGDLRAEMATGRRRRFPWPRPSALDDGVLEEDLERIELHYRARGFESVEVVEVRREIDEESGAIDVTVAVREGAESVVRKVELPAVPGLDERALGLETRPGARFDGEAIERDRRTILDALGRAGYARPQVEAEVRRTARNDRRVDTEVAWRVEPGLRQEAGLIIAQGNVDTRDRVILREVPLATGEPLDTGALLEAQGNLYRLGLFRRVSVVPLGEEDAPVRDVGVSISEQASGTFLWGGGYNTRDGLLAFAEVGFDNLQGLARRANLFGRFSLDPDDFTPDQYLTSLDFRAPRIFESMVRFSTNVTGERTTQSIDPYNVERVAWTNSLDRELLPGLRSGVEVQGEYANVFDVPPDARLSSKDHARLYSVGFGPVLLHDRRDDPFSPRRGFVQSFRLRYSPPELSTVQLVRMNVQHTHYLPVAGGVGFVYSGSAGWSHALSGADQVPIRDRFFLGGRNTVRGFDENSIGPRGAEGSRTGGDFAINATVELLVPLLYGIEAALFVDGGGLYLVDCDTSCRADKGIQDGAFTLENFRRSAGPGLRYRTPVGAIGVDYGIKLDRRSGESFGEVHFGIGVSF